MNTGSVPTSIGIVSLAAVSLTEPDRGFPVGGSELQLYLLAKRLARMGDFRVTLYVADLGQPERVEEGIAIRPAVKMQDDLRLTAIRSLRLIRMLARGGHDIYITRSASGMNGLVRLAARLAGGRHVHMCAHDSECTPTPDASLSRLAKRLHRSALRKADLILCQTPRQVETLKKFCGRDGKIVPNLLPEAVPPEPAGPRSGPSTTLRAGALWVGRDVDWKQPELFLELARRLPELPFTMVCQPQRGRDLERLSSSAPANLRLAPGLPFVETGQLFGRHKVLLLTSRAEGFPNVLLQAAQAGTPTVSLCLDPGGRIRRCRAGVVCDGSFDDLVRRTRELLTDAASWRACHEGALQLAKEMESAGNPIVEILQSLALGGRGLP